MTLPVTGVTAAPNRIASLNLCTDSMLFELVPPERIVSVTKLSRDENLSYFSALAERLPVNRGLAEEIIPLQPDLVVAGRSAAVSSVAMLERLGLPVLSFDGANSIAEFRANFLRLADAVGARARAEHLLRAFTAKLEHLGQTARTPGLRTVVYQANGYVAGTDTLIGELIRAAGLHNAASDFALPYGGFVSIEGLLVARPQLLVFGRRMSTYPSLADHLLHHPALNMRGAGAATQARWRHVTIPTRLWACGGTFLSEAMALLVSAAGGTP